MKTRKPMKTSESMAVGEILETIAILAALAALIPVAYWWHADDHNLVQHRSYFYYLLFPLLCILGYVTYRRIKRLRAALKSSKKRGSRPRIPPFHK